MWARGPASRYRRRRSTAIMVMSRRHPGGESQTAGTLGARCSINPGFTFDSFVEARAISSPRLPPSKSPAIPARPITRCSSMRCGSGQDASHARRGQQIEGAQSEARLAYVHSERFVSDMVKSLQHNTINDFKTAYRSLDALMIDDIQFLQGRPFAGGILPYLQCAAGEPAAVILTCDRYPRRWTDSRSV